MKRNRIWPLFAVLLSMIVVGRSAVAEEPVKKFLDALRDKGYHDMALEYLDQVKGSPLTPQNFKEILAYERGVTLIDAADQQRDAAIRGKQLTDAHAALTEFVTQSPDHQLIFSAKNQLGNLIVRRAKAALDRSRKPSEAAKKVALVKEARGLFDEAYKTFATLQADLKERLEKIPKVLDEKKDARRIELRDQMRTDYLVAQVVAAAVLEDASDTVDKNSAEFKDLLTKAAKEYGEIYNKHRTLIAGQYARLYQGRCFQKMSNPKEALSYYMEILDQKDETKEFHNVKTKALQLSVECWMDESQKKYAEIVDRAGKWIEGAHPDEMRDPDFMQLRLTFARASKLYVDDLKKKDPKDAKVNSLLSDARKQAQYVAKYPGEHQKDAQRLLGELGVEVKTSTGPKTFKTFAEAKAAANDAIETANTAKFTQQTFPDRIRQEKDPEEKKRLQQQLAEAEKSVQDGYAEAFPICREALTLVDSDTDIDDVNAIRHLLCFLYYNQGQYYDASVVGDYLCKRFPESGGARQSAKIAMASYLKLYGDAKSGAKEGFEKMLAELDMDTDSKLALDEIPEQRRGEFAEADADHNGKIDLTEWTRKSTRFESDRIIDIANYVNQRWPDQVEAQEALNTLITFMINEGELAKAEEYLSKIPVDSPQRGSAELKTGQAMWSHYLRGMQAIHEQETSAAETGTDVAAVTARVAPLKAELEQIKVRAEKTLADGVTRMEQSGKIDGVLATAILSLAQIYVGTNQSPQAIAKLENEKIGLLGLVAQNHEATQGKGFVQETYKVALRAYISALSISKDAKDAEALIGKARGIMEKLQAAIGSNPDGQKQLIAIYFSLAKDLQQQMDLATPDTRKNLAKGFKTFLDQVGTGSNELNVLYWVASTFASMGESADPKSADGKEHFQQAVKTYQDILDKDKRKELSTSMDPQMRGQISLQLARTLRSKGDFEGAINVLKGVLTENNVMLPAQIEAAKTFQEWGSSSGDLKQLSNSINGAFKDAKGKSIIWGWNQISKMTSNKAPFHNSFYESRYNIGLSLYRMGLIQKTADAKKKSLSSAEEALTLTLRLFPKLEGDGSPAQKDFRPEYDGLIKQIQKANGEKETGLAGYLKAVEEQKQATPVGTKLAPPPAKKATTAQK